MHKTQHILLLDEDKKITPSTLLSTVLTILLMVWKLRKILKNTKINWLNTPIWFGARSNKLSIALLPQPKSFYYPFFEVHTQAPL